MNSGQQNEQDLTELQLSIIDVTLCSNPMLTQPHNINVFWNQKTNAFSERSRWL